MNFLAFKIISVIEDAMRRDTAAPPPFVVVPFREVRLLAVDGILRIVIWRSVCCGNRLRAWFFAGSWLVLGGPGRFLATCEINT